MFDRKAYKTKVSAIAVPDIYDLTEDIKNIIYMKVPDSKRVRAICSFLYLSACRRNEVARNETKETPFFFVKYIKETEDGWLFQNMRTLKRKDNKLRVIPIPNNACERQLIGYIYDYTRNMSEDKEFYPLTTRTLWRDVIMGLGIKPHILRHYRLSHLVSLYSFTEQQLVAITEWTTSAPAKVYVHVAIKDLMTKMVGVER